VKRWGVKLGLLAALLLFLALNVVAFFQAWRMTHFSASGKRTGSPEKLSSFEKVMVLLGGVSIPRPECGPVGPEFPQPSQTVHFSTRDGVNLEAWVIPSHDERAVAVLFHGHASAKSGVLGEARVLRDLGVRTVLVDFRGSGGSDGWDTTLGWRESADVAAAAAWTRKQWPDERLILYGVSMGAAAVLRAVAVEGVRPDGVAVECAFDNLVTTVGHRNQEMGLPTFPIAQLLLFWGGVQHGFNAFAHNPAGYARSVTCPALVMDGENDPWVKPAEARRVASAMRGPTQCRIFTGGKHGGFWWDMPDDYRKTVADWLEALPTSQKNGSGK
jgi:dipeptidyl aminopeptidase/acylaminoacyl peptidase